MKTITEMSEQEILSLTGEQLETLIKIRMAEEGIKILTEPKAPDYLPIALQDVLAYKVVGYEYVFVNSETAQKASEAILSMKESLRSDAYGQHYELKYLVTDENYNWDTIGNIQPVKYYSRKLALEMTEAYSANARLKKQHEDLRKEYQDNYNSAQYIREEIYDRYNEVVEKYQKMERMKLHYNEYLQLAENDSETALKFLKKAYTVDAETEQFILS